MVAVTRSTPNAADASAAPGEITSPRVATNVIIGMVLGIVCFAGMLIAYQALACPCRRTPKRAPRSTAAPRTPTTPSSARSFIARFGPHSNPSKEGGTDASHGRLRSLHLNAGDIAFVKRLRAWLSGPPRAAADTTPPTKTKPTLAERRTLRRLHLLPTTTAARTSPRAYALDPESPSPSPRFSRFRMDLRSPGLSPIPASPRSPFGGRSRYMKLDDSPYYRTEKPKSAVLSPWSPAEGEYPYRGEEDVLGATTPTPASLSFSKLQTRTPPPVYPPPPAYLPETPLRGTFESRTSAPPTPRTPTPARPSPLANMLDPDTPTRAMGDWRSGIAGAGEPDPFGDDAIVLVPAGLAREVPPEGAFVIANESEDGHSVDSTWDASSDSESVYTDPDDLAGMEPLRI